jgi:pimeloyl-ACP methyl ester carboxylesterase
MKMAAVLAAIVICAVSVVAQNAEKPAAPAQSTADVQGTWLGTLDAGAVKLRVAFDIRSTASGLTATMDSLDQGAKGIPIATVSYTRPVLTLAVTAIGGTYRGDLAPDGETISGTWSQGGGSLPLLLKRVKQTELQPPRRPQLPVKPYPYHEEDVVIENAAANVKLAGTLTVPQGPGPFPAVLLITGSGPQDRDESLMGHKPFLVLADHLTRQGIAVLRLDDRGVAKSTGNFAAATTADFSTDAEAGFLYLLSRTQIERQKVGLIGHSEGGLIAPMVAARNEKVAFIVLMAATGVPGDEVLVEQVRMLAAASGAPSDQVAAAAEREREILAILRNEADATTREQKVREKLAGALPEAQLTPQLKMMESPWFRYFLQYDPKEALRRVKCPVLAIDGDKDTQVSAQTNLPAIRDALLAGGNKQVETVDFPALNHLFQTAKSGAPSEYGVIEETFSPVALNKISGWILAQAASRTPHPSKSDSSKLAERAGLEQLPNRQHVRNARAAEAERR